MASVQNALLPKYRYWIGIGRCCELNVSIGSIGYSQYQYNTKFDIKKLSRTRLGRNDHQYLSVMNQKTKKENISPLWLQKLTQFRGIITTVTQYFFSISMIASFTKLLPNIPSITSWHNGRAFSTWQGNIGSKK